MSGPKTVSAIPIKGGMVDLMSDGSVHVMLTPEKDADFAKWCNLKSVTGITVEWDFGGPEKELRFLIPSPVYFRYF